MKRLLIESRMQGWRVLALTHNGAEHLIYVGMSYEQVKKNYLNSFFTVLTDEEQANIKRIEIQRWNGVPDSGKWICQQESVRIPKTQIIEEDDDMEVEDATLQPV